MGRVELRLFRKGGKIYIDRKPTRDIRSESGAKSEAREDFPSLKAQSARRYESKIKELERQNRAGSEEIEKYKAALETTRAEDLSLRKRLEERRAADFDSAYQIILTDDTTEHPFGLSKELYEKALDFSKIPDSERRARTLFDWILSNVSYDHDKFRKITARKLGIKIRSAQSTYRDKSGVCTEQAYLYVAMARASGLRASWVYVEKDCNGEDLPLGHACAEVELPNRKILADPAYSVFGADHKKFRRLSDSEATRMFESWRRT